MFKKISQFHQTREVEKQKEEYSKSVQGYLKRNKNTFMSKLADVCEKKHGRIAYEDIEEVLGYEYPKARWIDSSNKKAQIVIFFKEVGIPFKADDTHLYFP